MKKFILLFLMLSACGVQNHEIPMYATSNVIDAPLPNLDEVNKVNFDDLDGFVKPVSEIDYTEQLARPGWEERGSEYIKWLAPSVRIGGGSGTIIHYDPQTKWAYIISCGHLFSGGYLSATKAKENQKYVNIEVFYHNTQKLSTPRKYRAELLCYVNNLGNGIYDVSLMRFKADWDIAWVSPIAAKDIDLKSGQVLNSVGCDGRSETALYKITLVRERQRGNYTELVSQNNSPRKGRSGGGVMTDDGELVAICSRGGSGYGYWTSLQQIHNFLNVEKEYAWLLDVRTPSLIKTMPIVDGFTKKRLNIKVPMPL